METKLRKTKAFYKKQHKRELAAILMQIRSTKLMDEFLQDLLSPKEYDELAKRLQVVKQLKRGVSQRDIAKNLEIGIATVTRGSRELADKNGGFAKVLNKL